jgi:hypothetical protein
MGMAKRKAARRAKPARGARKAARKTAATRSRGKTAGRAKARKSAAPKASARTTTKSFGRPPGPGQGTRTKAARLDRERRILEETVPTPPSSLNLDRHGSAARTGRAELAESLDDHRTMAGVSGGDVDADVEQAYFSGDEAPGGDNPTPDQDIVDDIGKALGVEYQDNEELKSTDKVTERDRHRWELDPASAEDYKERK